MSLYLVIIRVLINPNYLTYPNVGLCNLLSKKYFLNLKLIIKIVMSKFI